MTTRALPVASLILGLAVAGLAVLYLASIGPYWNISPDSASYVEWARLLLAGEGFGDVPFHPPATSLLYAAVLFFFPDGYVALNALNTVMILAAIAVASVMLSREVESNRTTHALVVALLSLASITVYHESTELLSEPGYLLVSVLALFAIQRLHAQPLGRTDRTITRLVAGVCIVLTAMSRTIGIALALAMLAAGAGRWMIRKQRPDLVLAGFALLALAATGVWEWYALRPTNATKFQMFVLDDPWSPASGYLGPLALARRVLANLRHAVSEAGLVMLNGWRANVQAIDVGLRVGFVLAIIGSLTIALRARLTVTAAYVTIYLAVIAAHVLVGGYNPARHLVAVMPFIFHYLIIAGRRLFAAARLTPMWLTGHGLASAYLAGFTIVGVPVLMDGIREQHSSPFGEYPVKRRSNFDAQRHALWIRDQAAPSDRYAARQVDMFNVLAERTGVPLSAGSLRTAETFVAWVRARDVRYVIADLTLAPFGDSLVSLMRARSDVFRPVSELRRASLFEVIARP